MPPDTDRHRRHRLYTDLATNYDRVYGTKDYHAEVMFVKDRFDATVDTTLDRALIVGCGTGGHAQHLVTAGVDVLGIDPNPAMLTIARKKVPDARFQTGRLPDLSLPTVDPFDLCWLPFTVVNYLAPAELDQAIETLLDHLADSGLVVIDNGSFPTDRPMAFDLIDGEQGGCCRFYGFEPIDEQRVRMTLLFVLPPDRFVVDTHTLTAFGDSAILEALSTAGLSVDRYGWYADEPPAVDGPSVFVGSR